jgi:hypothetical protein
MVSLPASISSAFSYRGGLGIHFFFTAQTVETAS